MLVAKCSGVDEMCHDHVGLEATLRDAHKVAQAGQQSLNALASFGAIQVGTTTPHRKYQDKEPSLSLTQLQV